MPVFFLQSGPQGPASHGSSKWMTQRSLQAGFSSFLSDLAVLLLAHFRYSLSGIRITCVASVSWEMPPCFSFFCSRKCFFRSDSCSTSTSGAATHFWSNLTFGAFTSANFGNLQLFTSSAMWGQVETSLGDFYKSAAEFGVFCARNCSLHLVDCFNCSGMFLCHCRNLVFRWRSVQICDLRTGVFQR